MSPIKIIVAEIKKDVMAGALARCILARGSKQEMELLIKETQEAQDALNAEETGIEDQLKDEHLVFTISELEVRLRKELLDKHSESPRFALLLVGEPSATKYLTDKYLAKYQKLVVLQIEIKGAYVHISLVDTHYHVFFNTLRVLANNIQNESEKRSAYVQLDSQAQFGSPAVPGLRANLESSGAIEAPGPSDEPSNAAAKSRENTKQGNGRKNGSSLDDDAAKLSLRTVMRLWLCEIFRAALNKTRAANQDDHSLYPNVDALLQSLDDANAKVFEDETFEKNFSSGFYKKIDTDELLARLAKSLDLNFVQVKLLALVLAPELGHCFQRCIGYLSHDMSRQVGTFGFYRNLLGNMPEVREQLAKNDAFVRWSIFEPRNPNADDPVRVETNLAHWLLEDGIALEWDLRLRRCLRRLPWPGAEFLVDAESQHKARELLKHSESESPTWHVLSGDDPAGWRAMLELSSQLPEKNWVCAENTTTSAVPRTLFRVELTRLAGMDAAEIEETALRLARLAKLTDSLLAIDLTTPEGQDEQGPHVDHFLTSFEEYAGSAFFVCQDPNTIIRAGHAVSLVLEKTPPLSREARAELFRKAGSEAHVYLSSEEAQQLAGRSPLSIDALAQAVSLVQTSRSGCSSDEERFKAACKLLAIDGLSHLAEHIEPVFHLEDVVLSADRKRQLRQIVDHVRLAPQVLDGWKFGEQMPYGRGVAALFHGPSGTGKTMAAMSLATELEVPLLRFDLSRVVSKYIGDTEKNIDRVFNDAQRSGSIILIDEADALLGKRSEVKDAHDRYANIEVAYMLQRMENYPGLAILTSNMRQNLDGAFLRRLRFIIDFPRPDAAAREQIWRFCLPEEAHELCPAAFRELARKVELTGGHIRQICLHAAFLAAAAEEKIQFAHLAEATVAEYAKLGLPPVKLEAPQSRRVA